MEHNFKVSQTVSYSNGNPSIYTGTIVKVSTNEIVIIDDESGMILWNMGYAVGSCIHPSQVLN